jgi:hypothetical protein
MTADANRRQSDPLIVAIDPVAIVVVRARETDHLPRRQVLVAAIDRIGKKTGLSVLEDLLEESLGVETVKLE